VGSCDTALPDCIKIALASEVLLGTQGIQGIPATGRRGAHTVSWCLPFKRRLLSKALPSDVLILAIKPCRRSRRLFLGCHVRLGTEST
jgi:hypothetical protein